MRMFLAGWPILACINVKHAIAHNKIMNVDSKTVLTGSFKFTKAVENHCAAN